eukprot:gene347-biopygen64
MGIQQDGKNRANAAPQAPPQRSRTPARAATPKAAPKPAPKAMGPPAPKRHGKEQRTGKRPNGRRPDADRTRAWPFLPATALRAHVLDDDNDDDFAAVLAAAEEAERDDDWLDCADFDDIDDEEGSLAAQLLAQIQ